MGPRLCQSGSDFARAVALAIVLIGGARMGLAQDPAGELPAARPMAAKPLAHEPLPNEVGPPVFMLPDKNGKLQPVAGLTLEDFTAIWKQKNQLDQTQQQPAFTLEELTITGAANGQRAELVAEYKFTTHVDGWVKLPLRLNEAVLSEPASYQGAGKFLLEPSGDGYVLWVRDQPASAQRVTLKLLAPLSQVGPETHLKLNLPRAAVSRLQLVVPGEGAVAKVSDGSVLEPALPAEGDKTELKVVGLGGELDLSWHPPDSKLATLPTVLEATAAQLVRINAQAIASDATLTVRSLGGEFDRFAVRLPPGAEHVGAAQPGLTLTLLDAADAKGKLYEVRLEKKTIGPVEVRLVTERRHDASASEESVQLAGFEVQGAVRQWGTIGIQVEGAWQLLFGETDHLRQVDELRGPRRDELTAGFEYFAQPCSLTARIVPQKTRVRVEPEYVMLVGSDQAQLRAKFKYTIRGAKVRSLTVELPGWEVDNIGPADLVNVDAAMTDEARPLVIPLLQATSGELEITLQARQKLAPEMGSIALEAPRPQAEIVAATVAVLPEDNIELTLEPEQTTALTPLSVRPPLKLPERQQDPLFFRASGASPKFVATLRVHEQAISASMATQLEVDERETRVDQRFTFAITYQPTDFLVLGVPRALRPDWLSISLDGQKLLPLPVRPRSDAEGDWLPLRVPLPSPRIGRCELQVSYVVRHERLSSTASTLATVPLVVPGQGQLTGNELSVVSRPNVAATYPKGPWTEDAGSRPAGEGSLTLSARKPLTAITLGLSSKARAPASSTTIEKAWLRTYLTDAGRHDRAIFRLVSQEPRLQLRLPEGADSLSLEAELNGRRIVPEAIRQQEVTIALANAGRTEHLLTLRYHFATRPPLGSSDLAAPRIPSAKWVQQLYWEVSVPRHEHVLFAPERYTSEYRWSWSNLVWQRQASLEPQDLARWMGGVSADPARIEGDNSPLGSAAAEAYHRYLFSTVGELRPLDLHTISRSRLVLWASLPVLIVGLSLIYFPATRHPGVLFALAVIVAAGSLIDPDSALLLAQAASLGLVLAVCAAILARAMPARPAPQPIPVRGSSRAIERSVTELYGRPPSGGSQPSTTTTPLVPSLPEAQP